MSYTLALIKPDAVANPVTLKWISEALFFNGLQVTKGCRLKLSREQAIKLYSVHKEKFFYSRLIRHICSGTSILMRLECLFHQQKSVDGFHSKILRCLKLNTSTPLLQTDEIINKWRSILGPSKLFKNILIINGPINESDFVNLRQYFALSDTRNVGHGSDSIKELEKEIKIFEKLMHTITDVNSELFELNKFYVPYKNDNLEFSLKNIFNLSEMFVNKNNKKNNEIE